MEHIYNMILRKCWPQDYYSISSIVVKMSSKHKSRSLFEGVRFGVFFFFLYKNTCQVFHNELILSLISLFPSFFCSR